MFRLLHHQEFLEFVGNGIPGIAGSHQVQRRSGNGFALRAILNRVRHSSGESLRRVGQADVVGMRTSRPSAPMVVETVAVPAAMAS